MGFKEKLIGVLLIALGALPWLLKVETINNTIGDYAALPGTSMYQTIIIVLGLFLLIKIKHKVHVEPTAK